MKLVNLIRLAFFKFIFAKKVEFRRKYPSEGSSLFNLKGKRIFCRNSPTKQS